MTGAAWTADRWRRIEELFQTALDIPQAQRDAFLRGACGSDDALRLDIESLLANDYQESPLIAFIVDDATSRMLEDDDGRAGE
jgi:serine/threonine-protein kinase